jgi:hypothetical protein
LEAIALPAWFPNLLSFLKDWKHTILGAISIILAIYTYYKVDSGNAFLVKLGLSLFLCFFFFVYLVIFELAIFIYKKIRNYITAKKEKKRQNEFLLEKQIKKAQAEKLYREEKEQLDIEELRSFVDSLNSRDRGYLKKLFQTSNKPITINEEDAINSKLFKSIYVYKTESEEAKQIPININRDNSNRKSNYIPIDTYDIKPAKEKFMLTEETFNFLKLSQEKYGCISHFN